MSEPVRKDDELPAVGSPVERGVMRPVEHEHGCSTHYHANAKCDCAPRTVAALYVEPKGCYVGAPGVDPWDETRDARKYAGPHPVVAHPPCQRWGRFWHGSTRKPHQYKLGDDGGCFTAALAAVKRWGGVLEHPAHSKAWDAFELRKPVQGAGWWWCQRHDVWVCHVEQGHYGHDSRKPTWLIAAGVVPHELPPMCGSDIGYLHTPTTKANYAATSMQKWPSARNFVRAFGRPCPGVQEWMMGWPEGWSDTKPLETAKYQSWLRRLCGHWRMLTAND